MRLPLACLVPFLWVAVGYNFSFFTVFATSELAVLLWALVVALTNKGTPHNQPQSAGTLAMVKVAVGMMYPQAGRAIDRLQHTCILVFSVMQDLCVSVFMLVVLATVSHFTSVTVQ